MAIINFGSINIDHIYSVPHFVTPGETLSSSQYQFVLGGKGANQSIAGALAGAEVKHVGAINKRDVSFVEQLIEKGVNCDWVAQLDSSATKSNATGHALIQVNDEGENAIVLYAGANHQLTKAQIKTALQDAGKQDWVLLQNETNDIADVIELAAKNSVNIAFNPAPMTDEIAQLPLQKVDLLFVNEIEAMQLTNTDAIDKASDALAQQYPNTKVIMTLGKKGVCYLHKGERISVDGFKVDAVDTTAAGDTFTGYFLANYLKSTNITDALTRACAAAALCVTKKGAAPSIPHEQDVKQFLLQNR